MVEVWDGDQFIAGIYAGNDRGALRIVTKYPVTVDTDEKPPLAVNVKIECP